MRLEAGGAGLEDCVCMAWVLVWEWGEEEKEGEGARVMLELVSAIVESDLPSPARVCINLLKLKCVPDGDGSGVDTGESIVDTGEFTTPFEAINGG